MSTTTDNSGNVAWKPLKSDRFDLDLRGYVVRLDGEVPHAHAATTISSNIVLAEVENQRDVHKSRKIYETLTPSTVVDAELGTAWEELRRFADKWTVTKTMVANSTMPAAAFKQVLVVKKEHNPANWKYDLIVVNAWETRTRQYVDEEWGIQFTVTESVVLHGTAIPTDTVGKFYAQRQVDLMHDILTETTIGDGTTAYERRYLDQLQYTYPALLAAWNGSETTAPVVLSEGVILTGYFEESNLRSVWNVNVPLREAFTEMAYVQIHEKVMTAAQVEALRTLASIPSWNIAPYGSGADLGTDATLARLFTPRPRDISINGVMLQLHVPNVLTDAYSYNITSNIDDEYYGFATEAIAWPASNITATAYIALIGATVCIADNITPWRGGSYMRRRVYIKVK